MSHECLHACRWCDFLSKVKFSDSVETVDLGGMERTGGGPHNVEVGVGTTVVTATMELSVLLLLPGWLVISE